MNQSKQQFDLQHTLREMACRTSVKLCPLKAGQQENHCDGFRCERWDPDYCQCTDASIAQHNESIALAVSMLGQNLTHLAQRLDDLIDLVSPTTEVAQNDTEKMS